MVLSLIQFFTDHNLMNRLLISLLLLTSILLQICDINQLGLKLWLKWIGLRITLLAPLVPDISISIPLVYLILPIYFCIIKLHSLLEYVLEAREPRNRVLAVLIELMHLNVLGHMYLPDCLCILLLHGLYVKLRFDLILIFIRLFDLRLARDGISRAA